MSLADEDDQQKEGGENENRDRTLGQSRYQQEYSYVPRSRSPLRSKSPNTQSFAGNLNDSQEKAVTV